MVPAAGVVLFRDNNSGAKDSYTELLSKDPHRIVESVGVLDHEYLITPDILDRVVSADQEFNAIIFTSQNAILALCQAAQLYLMIGGSTSDKYMGCTREQRLAVLARFLSKPVFVVGRATASAYTEMINSLFGDTQEADQPVVDIRGKDTGKATAMLPKILQFCRQNRDNTGSKTRLAFFCGNQRRDTLPQGIRGDPDTAELTEITSYTTVGRPADQVKCDLIAALQRIHAQQCQASDLQSTWLSPIPQQHATTTWLVMFSPSGVRVVAPLLDELAKDRSILSPSACSLGETLCSMRNGVCWYRLLAIGETTMNEMLSMQGLQKQAIVLAKEPSAQGIRNAIIEAENPFFHKVL